MVEQSVNATYCVTAEASPNKHLKDSSKEIGLDSSKKWSHKFMEIVGLQNKSEHQQHLQRLLNTTEFMQPASFKKIFVLCFVSEFLEAFNI